MPSLNSLSSHFKALLFNLIFIFIFLGCFFSTSSKPRHYHLHKRKRKIKPFSTTWSFLKHIFSPSKHSLNKKNNNNNNKPFYASTVSCPSSSPRSSQQSLFFPFTDHDPTRIRQSGFGSDSLSENPFLPLRNDIFPCPSCGEIFLKINLLEHHKTTKHAVSELREGDSSKNVVLMIFKSGWPMDRCGSPRVHRVLKIHNSQKILARFEEYRENVKMRAARVGYARGVADGNEVLRFHCTTFVCNLGQNGNSSVCNHRFCSACGIIRVGFSSKLDGISTLSSSWRAHVALPDDVETEFAFMNVKRAMLVCRVIAGRVGYDPLLAVDKENLGLDSLMGRLGSAQNKPEDDELLVFNPRAVLPCFVIVYSV